MAIGCAPLLGEIPVSAGLWLWGALTLVLTAVLAFLAGMAFARVSARWTLERARRHVARLVPLVVDSLRTADEACRSLAEITALRLTAVQLEQIAASRTRLVETWSRIDERQQETALRDALEAQRTAQAAAEFHVGWVREPADERSGLPDRGALNDNLDRLLFEGSRAEVDSGLLLIRIDRLDPLRTRFGPRAPQQLVERMARLLCQSIRDKDLVCRFSADSFAVLMPGVDRTTGDRLADAIRGTVRDHHFRLEETGPEVFVTASFGYTGIKPHENADLVIDRAVHALAESERRGRNQLHVHDGSQAVHCAAT
ncbi:MAG TPA: GGDEF domain-containing protein [Planctomycetaceae bacterium]|nr:GGDEF domain-containing protein [Planctomycetaceae bacterium]